MGSNPRSYLWRLCRKARVSGRTGVRGWDCCYETTELNVYFQDFVWWQSNFHFHSSKVHILGKLLAISLLPFIVVVPIIRVDMVGTIHNDLLTQGLLYYMDRTLRARAKFESSNLGRPKLHPRGRFLDHDFLNLKKFRSRSI